MPSKPLSDQIINDRFLEDSFNQWFEKNRLRFTETSPRAVVKQAFYLGVCCGDGSFDCSTGKKK